MAAPKLQIVTNMNKDVHAHLVALSKNRLSRIMCVISLFVLQPGCHVANMFAGPGDYYRNYYESDSVCSIDQSIEAERDRKLPSGYLTREYSPDHWQEYWNRRLSSYLDESSTDLKAYGYEGTSRIQFAQYILVSRREFGLPDISPEHHIADFVLRTYSVQSDRPSCELLRISSPLCTMSPAQYPQGTTIQRGCGRTK
jgi:hypothetical protein